MRVPAILVTGPGGVGKTTLIGEMSMVLAHVDIPHATVDFDNLTECYPRGSDDDIWGTSSASAIWQNYRDSGADRLLIARVIGSRLELDGYRAAVPGAEIIVVRLRASPKTLQARVRQRGPGSDMEWHLARAVEPAALMEEQPVQDLVIDTEGRDPTDLAREILHRVGWLEQARGSAGPRD